MDLRGTVGSIYKGEYYTLVHTTYESALGHMVLEKIFMFFFPIVSLRELLTSRGGAISERTAIHCCTQNMKALGLVVSKKIFFMFFS